jgi:glycosyltransferase involved in cell wall biosynthesis
MLKVCHVSSGHEITDTRIFKRECTTLHDNGLEVSLVAQHSKAETIEGINVVNLPVVGERWFQRLVLLLPITIRLLKRDYDIYHFHDPDLLPVMLTVALLTNRKTVWDVHEEYISVTSRANKFGIKPLTRLIMNIFERSELQICRLVGASVVTVSEGIAERYRRAGLNTTICANYVDHRRVQFPPRVRRTAPPLALMTGTIQSRFSPETIVEVFARVNRKMDCRLAFAGTFFPKSLSRQIMERAEILGVGDAVQCGGPFPWETLVGEIIPAASVGLVLELGDPHHPQTKWAVPNKLFEYWVNGVPALANKDTLFGDLVEEVEGGLTVDFDDIEDITTKMELLLSDKHLSQRMGSNGRRAVTEKYNWVTEGMKLLDLYGSLSEKTN